MKELSLHILDLVENSFRAKAKKVRISILEDTRENRLELIIEDDGEGRMKKLYRGERPFSSGQNKKVGMGIPLLDQLTKQCQGEFRDILRKGARGPLCERTFLRDNLDLPPLGKLTDTLFVIMVSHPRWS